MKRIILLTLLFFSSNVFAQLYKLIEKEAANVMLTKNNPEEKIDLENLKTILFSGFDEADLERTYNVLSKDLDSLKNHFTLIETESKNISFDSTLFLFNQWYLYFCNVFYKYRKAKFFSSINTKILFFTTSMSCHCTLEMCKKQLIDILKLLSQKRGGCPCSGRQINTEKYELLVVDAYEYNKLQLKYETFFPPSVIVLDGNNKVLYKIEYDDRMLEQLTAFINSNLKLEGFN